ncbi:MAG: TRAP transporter substrate-binding protein DctP [Hahellaceae bacterium]|nr:TRAP transporter substrate-binding protein DctP [Hahellaceae bacterium]MCP5209760.1 TRAP transporter substrate-binding protein DctP [Hahellaceae bacterium]
MSRVLRLIHLSWICVLALLGCQQAEEAPVFHWQLQSHAVAQANDFKELVTFAENVRVMSGGRLNITPHAGGSDALVVGPDIFAAVSDGRIEMGNGWPNWWSGQHPAWAVMNAGPFDFMNLDASMLFFLGAEGTQLANELSQPKGVIWRAAWWPGMEFGLLSRAPINSLDDLKGKKVRIGPGLPSEVLAAASGAYAIPTVPSEIRPALASGALDAVEWTTTSGAWDLGLQDLSPYAIVPAIWQPSVLSDFLINEKAYAKLPPDLKLILETAIKAYTLTTTIDNKINDFEALKKFKAEGVTLNTWTEADLARWKVASDEVYRKYKAENDFSKKFIEHKQAFKQEYNDYYSLFGPYD